MDIPSVACTAHHFVAFSFLRLLLAQILLADASLACRTPFGTSLLHPLSAMSARCYPCQGFGERAHHRSYHYGLAASGIASSSPHYKKAHKFRKLRLVQDDRHWTIRGGADKHVAGTRNNLITDQRVNRKGPVRLRIKRNLKE